MDARASGELALWIRCEYAADNNRLRKRAGSGPRPNYVGELVGASTFGSHFGLSAGLGQFFESVAIQRFASSSVAKSPT
jgi:hypothetical protein